MTIDASTIDPHHPTGRGLRQALVPVIRVLHHPDLRRVGTEVRPKPLDDGEWVVIGRGLPKFEDGATLLDPCLSRDVLRVRWDATRMGFEVEIVAGQTVYVRTLVGAPCDVKRPLLPGTTLELRDRIMLLLTLAPAQRGRSLGMVGESVPIWGLRTDIERVARTHPRSVFVWGATGTGKELVARALHEASSRASGPFVALNCASLRGNGGDDCLFGHVAGAFTDARTARRGAFAEADGGTLFFDEIGELSLDMQARLLRVLEERRIVPLGAPSTAARDVDLQLVVATHRNLESEVRSGGFRADLYGRLMEPRINVPPLAARPEDAPLLFAHFLARRAPSVASSETLQRCFSAPDERAPRIDMGFVRSLLAHNWPLNVREVLRWAEWAVSWLGDERRIDETDGPCSRASASLMVNHSDDIEARSEPCHPLAQASDESPSAVETGGFLTERASRPGRDTLRAALRACDYSKTVTARTLGASRSTLDRWIVEYKLPTARTLSLSSIRAALERHDGDVATAAAELEVSERALRLRMRNNEN